MSNIWRKLNLKVQREILVLSAPSSFEAALDELEDVHVHRSLSDHAAITFLLAFVTEREEIVVLRPSPLMFPSKLASPAVPDPTEQENLIWFEGRVLLPKGLPRPGGVRRKPSTLFHAGPRRARRYGKSPVRG